MSHGADGVRFFSAMSNMTSQLFVEIDTDAMVSSCGYLGNCIFFLLLVTKHTTYMSWSWLTKISWWKIDQTTQIEYFENIPTWCCFPCSAGQTDSAISPSISNFHTNSTQLQSFVRCLFRLSQVNWRNWWLKCFDYELLIDEKLQSSRVIK